MLVYLIQGVGWDRDCDVVSYSSTFVDFDVSRSGNRDMFTTHRPLP